MTNFEHFSKPIIHFGNAHEQAAPKPSTLILPKPGGMGSASLAASRDVRECAEAEHEDERPPHEIHAASLSGDQS